MRELIDCMWAHPIATAILWTTTGLVSGIIRDLARFFRYRWFQRPKERDATDWNDPE